MHLRERDALVRTGAYQLALARDQLVADGSDLVRPGLNGPRLGRDDASHLARPLSRRVSRGLGSADAGGDLLVLGANLIDVVEAVDRVCEAAGAEDDVEGVHVALLVDLYEPGVQACEREVVLVAEVEVALRLDLEELGQAVELALVEREVGFESGELG